MEIHSRMPQSYTGLHGLEQVVALYCISLHFNGYLHYTRDEAAHLFLSGELKLITL